VYVSGGGGRGVNVARYRRPYSAFKTFNFVVISNHLNCKFHCGLKYRMKSSLM
jgi:hypothetical protein